MKVDAIRAVACLVFLAILPWSNAATAASPNAKSKPQAAASKPKPPVDRAQFYGFRPVEVIKLEPRSSNMLSGDFNTDGKTDLVLFDNGHARIDLLLQRRHPADESADAGPFDVNELRGDTRFEHKRIPVDKQLASLAVGDFNGDGRTDIACFGLPDRLIVLYQPTSGEWKERTTIRVPDVAPAQWNLAGGDLNGDGKDDLVILGRHQTYIFHQRPKQGLSTNPTLLMNTSEKLSMAQIVDLNGDGRNDLCYVAGETQDRTLCARLQDASGRLGPELQFDVDRPRSVSYGEIDGRAGREILTIDAQTGRLRIQQLRTSAGKDKEPAGRLVQTGFGRQESADGRDFALGDIDGDGLADLVVTDPDGASEIVFRQRKGEGLDPGQVFPSFSGAVQVRVGPLADNPKEQNVVVLSTKERAIGISRFQGSRLTFPETLPIADEEPLVLELADLDGDQKPEIVYVTRSRQLGNSRYSLQALRRSKDKKWERFRFGAKKSTQVPIELSETPTCLTRFNAHRGGRADFLLFQGNDRAPLVVEARTDNSVALLPAESGPRLGNVGPGAVFLAKETVPTILVAQENFARRLQADGDRGWRVVDQYNAAESSARVVGAALIDLDDRPGPEVVLVDTGIRKLRVMRRDGDLFRPWKEIELGSFPYEAVRVADLNGDGRDDLLLIGRGRFAVLYAGKIVPSVSELATYETKLKKAYFSDVVAGDLNNDGRPDLALIDTQSHYVEILDFDRDRHPRHAFQFKVFEEKNFTEGQEGGTEPRESIIADLTGDGLADIVLLVHDRVLIYPQDDGK